MGKIVIDEAIVSDGGRRVENGIHPDLEYRPYFVDTQFYAEYPESVAQVPRGLLNIPALSTVLHFAVAVGADIEVGEVDAEYLKGAAEAQEYLRIAPGFSTLRCTTQIKAKPTKTTYDAPRQGLLFSGGSDSTCSWIRRRREDPRLYLIWGLDIPTGWPDFWARIEQQYRWLAPRIIKSNTEDLYATNLLYALGSALTEGYRPTYSFSVNALGVCAPLTYLDGVGLLQLSSTYPSRHYLNPRYPWAQYRPSFLVNQFWRWGSTRCAEVDHEYSTTEKIRYFLKPYVDAGNPVHLRSCGNREHLLKHKLENFACMECVPKGTLVYSNPSIEPIESINSDELIRGQNNAYQKVNHIFTRHYEGNMIKIKPLYFEEVSFTPNHEILVAIRDGNKECHLNRKLKYKKYHSISHTVWKKAEDIQKGDLVVIPKKYKTVKHVIDFTKYYKKPNHKIPSRSPVKGKKTYDEDMAELLGWYVAEGHYNPLSGAIEFTLSSEEVKEAERIIYLLKKVFGLKGRIWWKRAETTHSIRVLCGSLVLGRFLHESFGRYAKEKHLPAFVMNSSKSITSAFLEGYLLGDGCHAVNRGQRKRACASASKTLTKQIQMLLMKIGVVSGYSKTVSKPTCILQGRIVKSGVSHQLHFLDQRRYRKMYLEDGENFYIPIEKIETHDFSGTVHNLETEEHIYLLPFIVHNCDKCQRTIGMLAVNGVDPRRVGFPVNDQAWAKTRSDIETKRWNPVYLKYHWEEVQSLIDDATPDYGGSRAFMQWLRNYSFKGY